MKLGLSCVVVLGSLSACSDETIPADEAITENLTSATVALRVVRTSTAGGLTDQQIKDVVTNGLATINGVYQPRGITFTFNASSDYIVQATDLLDTDCDLAPGTNLNTYTDPHVAPPCDWAPHTQERLRVSDLTPGRAVVYVGLATSPVFDQTAMHWTLAQRNYYFSGSDGNYVAMTFGFGPLDLAHELGHYLHLSHTFGPLPASRDEAAIWIHDYVVGGGHPNGEGMNVFDGDRFENSDTPPDPGVGVYTDQCNDQEQPVLEVPQIGLFVVNPDRENIMNYFNKTCRGRPADLSSGQGARARRSFDYNRASLVSSSPVAWQMRLPALTAKNGSQVHAYLAGGDGHVWQHDVNLGAAESSGIGGQRLWGDTNQSPATIEEGGRVHVFIRKPDGSVGHRSWSSSTGWVPPDPQWQSLGGNVTGAPATVSWSDGRVDLFARGADGALWHKLWTSGGGWWPGVTSWETLGGSPSSDPVALSTGANRLDVFARGASGEVIHRRWNNNAWSPSASWESLGGSSTGAPAVTNWPDGTDKFSVAMTTTVGVGIKDWTGSAWSPSKTSWTNIGGGVVGTPALVAMGSNRIDLFARGMDGRIWHKLRNTGTWWPDQTNWDPLAGDGTSAPVAIAQSATTVRIYMVDAAGNLRSKFWDGSQWLPPDLLWTYMGRR